MFRHSRRWQVRLGSAWWLAALVVASLVATVQTGFTAPRCKGSKLWYAGDCRYPEQIQRMKAAAAAHKKRLAEQRQDKADCEQAQQDDTLAGWKKYLEQHSAGACAERARTRVSELEAIAAAPTAMGTGTGAPAPPPPDEKPVDDGAARRIGAYVAFGIGGVGLLIGAITGGLSLSKVSTLDEQCPDRVCTTDDQCEIDTTLTLAHVSTAGFVIGGVGAVTGLVLLLTAGSGSSTEPVEEQGVTVRPMLGPAMVGVSGRF